MQRLAFFLGHFGLLAFMLGRRLGLVAAFNRLLQTGFKVHGRNFVADGKKEPEATSKPAARFFFAGAAGFALILRAPDATCH
jgi:hypothetical protein